ncbi:MAG: hypothetical protein ACPGO7_00335 [Alphaproteobacteria bacterium]
MMQFLGPVANLASSWLQGKADANAANAKLKLTEAEAKAKILLSKETSTADWERIMAQGTQNSWKDEAVTILTLTPVALCFVPGLEQVVQNGFDRLSTLPSWYQNLVLVVCLSAIGIRGGKQFFGGKK